MNLQKNLRCPVCSSELPSNECKVCRDGLTRKEGIVSFVDHTAGHAHLSPPEVEKIADEFENQPDECALEFVLETHGRKVFDEIANVRTETWRMLVATELEGTCLNVSCGFGKSARMLAEVCDKVYAVDESLHQLRVLDNFATNDNIVSVHTEIDRLPFAEDSFDVIVISSIQRNNLREVIREVKKYLDSDGTLLVKVDGWTRIAGITRLFGLDADTSKVEYNPLTLLRSNTFSLRNAFEAEGYTDMDIFSTISTTNDRKVWSFNIEQDDILQWLLETDQRANLPTRLRVARSVGKVINKTGLLKHFYPGYLVACRKDDVDEAPWRSDELLMTGMNRTVLMSIDGSVQSIRKIPNSHSLARINQNAIDNLRQLQNTGIKDSLPTGKSTPTKFGVAWRENPVEGIPLNDSINKDIRGFRTCLTVGLDWLCRLARETINEKVDLPPRKVEEDLSHPEVCSIDDSKNLQMMRTAIHGDFSLPNIFANDGEVTTVIDWEFSRLDQYPVTDAGFFLLQTAEYLFEDFENGFDEVFLNGGQFRETCKEYVDRYCQRVGLPTESFITYLPYSYIRRARIDRENHHALDIDWAARADYIRQNQATLENVFL